MRTKQEDIEKQIKNVQSLMMNCLDDTKISTLLGSNPNIMGKGKMLRPRLLLSLGNANQTEESILIKAAAAVDIIHGASLLHDDVIDGGILRRGAPTFWKKHGTNGAILFGDFLMFKALSLLMPTDRSDLLKELINRSGEVCQSEVEQELILRGTPGTWADCEQVARYKTGSLFAFAAVAGSSGDEDQVNALREAGFILGTAYQLADDILDASGNEEISGKTLGTDHLRKKTTALTAQSDAPEDPIAYIFCMLDNSSALLANWPEVQQAWDSFLDVTMRPLLGKYINAS